MVRVAPRRRAPQRSGKSSDCRLEDNAVASNHHGVGGANESQDGGTKPGIEPPDVDPHSDALHLAALGPHIDATPLLLAPGLESGLAGFAWCGDRGQAR